MTTIPPLCAVERGRPVARGAPPPAAPTTADDDPCVMCGSTCVTWRKCKLVCETCSTILKSCADL